ncbi:cyclopropane-fatty-acyl-phospholipid synthase family protein [Dokdonella sp.]|uniref:SAM-dependent methyltransferase n=1 Tax=Dokdonella sp. TaxID=2291710 RepID=UPI0035283D7F
MSPVGDKEDPSAASLHGVNQYWRALEPADMDRGDHRSMVGAMWEEVGQLQFEFLRSEGLEPRHRLLDVGCGAMRGGVHFARYLDRGNYFGLDANASLIEAGRRELDLAGLADRDAQLIADANFDVARFDARFDYAIAVSLVTHLYFNHIQLCLARVAEHLEPGGRFYMTFFEAPAPAHFQNLSHAGGEITTSYLSDPYHQSFDELATLGRRAGLHAHRIGEFGHPRGQNMILFAAE